MRGCFNALNEPRQHIVVSVPGRFQNRTPQQNQLHNYGQWVLNRATSFPVHQTIVDHKRCVAPQPRNFCPLHCTSTSALRCIASFYLALHTSTRDFCCTSRFALRRTSTCPLCCTARFALRCTSSCPLHTQSGWQQSLASDTLVKTNWCGLRVPYSHTPPTVRRWQIGRLHFYCSGTDLSRLDVRIGIPPEF